MTRIVNAQLLVLPELSIALQTTVFVPNGKANPEGGAHVRLSDESHTSVATGGPNVTLANPESRGNSDAIMLDTHVISGGVVSTTAIVWLQMFEAPDASVTTQVRVAANFPPVTWFVTVLKMLRLWPGQLSLAVGGSKSQAVPHSTMRFVAHEIDGASVSLTPTWKEQLSMPAEFEAVQVTTLVPTGKAVPDGGEQSRVGVGSPVADGENVTTAEHWPTSLERKVNGGHVIIGGVPKLSKLYCQVAPGRVPSNGFGVESKSAMPWLAAQLMGMVP
jgi:hypothetical protein